MTSPRFLLIDGYGGTGKAVLWSLLEGHRDVFVPPVHDMLADAICGFPGDDWIDCRDSRVLRRILSTSMYYDLEHYSSRGFMELILSAQEIARVPIDLNFADYERRWTQRLRDSRVWTREGVLASLLECLGDAMGVRLSPHGLLVSICFNQPGAPLKCLRHLPSAKLVYLTRSVEGITASLGHRKPMEGDAASRRLIGRTPEALIRKGVVRKHRRRMRDALMASEMYPQRVLFISFDELVCQTESVMRRIAEFAGIEFEPCLLEATARGVPIRGDNGDSYLGNVYDRPENLLSALDRALLEIELRPQLLCHPKHWKKDVVLAVAGMHLWRIKQHLSTVRSALSAEM